MAGADGTAICPIHPARHPAIAKLWGRLCVQTGSKGIDNLIAATALVHNLLVVTRNVRDFEVVGARVLTRSGIFKPQQSGETRARDDSISIFKICGVWRYF